MDNFVSENLELDGEYVLIIDEYGNLKLLECGSIEEIEEGNLMEFHMPVHIEKFQVFK